MADKPDKSPVDERQRARDAARPEHR
jgi:hypothetical protein